MQIIVIGGGPAGSHVAELLARQDHSVALVDALGPWEKPCGGGVTAKALDLIPGIDGRVPHCAVESVCLRYGDRSEVEIVPSQPAVIFSRKVLARHLLQTAEYAGVRFINDRVGRIQKVGRRWRVWTRRESLSGDFLVGADGATSFVRRHVATPLTRDDLGVTLGYFVPSDPSSQMKIRFSPGLEGYLWSFPRPDHVSYGLISRPWPGWARRYSALLRDYVTAEAGPGALRNATPFSAPVPALSASAWDRNVVAGEGWALLGDAAGLVDPITGEGIYYALRSAQLLAAGFPDSGAYAAAAEGEFAPELKRAAKMSARFYRGRFLGRDFTSRMIELARSSSAVRTVLADLVVGSQGYVGLKRRLGLALPRVVVDLLLGACRT